MQDPHRGGSFWQGLRLFSGLVLTPHPGYEFGCCLIPHPTGDRAGEWNQEDALAPLTLATSGRGLCPIPRPSEKDKDRLCWGEGHAQLGRLPGVT